MINLNVSERVRVSSAIETQIKELMKHSKAYDEDSIGHKKLMNEIQILETSRTKIIENND